MNSRFQEMDINDLQPRQAPKRSVLTPSTAFIPTVPEVSVMFQDSFTNTSEAQPQQFNKKDEGAVISSKSSPLACALPTCECGLANKSGPNSPGQGHANGLNTISVIDLKHAEETEDVRWNKTMLREISNNHGPNYPFQRPESCIHVPINKPKHVGLEKTEDRRRNNFFHEISTQTEVDSTPIFFQSEEWKSCINVMSGIGNSVSELNHKVDRMCEFMQCTHQAVQSVNGSVNKVSSDIINLASKIEDLEKQFSSLNKDSRSISSSPVGFLLSPFNNDTRDDNDWTRYNEAAAEVVNNCHSRECDCQRKESVTADQDQECQIGVKDILMQHQQMKRQMEEASMQGLNMAPGSFLVSHPGRHTDEELNALAVAAGGGTTADICLNNMSFSTVDYLERHGIIRNPDDQSHGKRFANVRNRQDAPCTAEKQPQACGGVGYRCCVYHIEKEADNAKSSNRLLDITAIKRLPKLT